MQECGKGVMCLGSLGNPSSQISKRCDRQGTAQARPPHKAASCQQFCMRSDLQAPCATESVCALGHSGCTMLLKPLLPDLLV